MKYSGAGNTFIILDFRTPHLSLDQISLLCEHHEVDGCLLYQDSTKADACMRIINQDGSEAEMCGNGLRCFIHFLRELGMKRPTYCIETLAGIQEGWFVDEDVCVRLSSPSGLSRIDHLNVHFLNTGVPHAVYFVEDLDQVDVALQGRKMRNAEEFAPEGANVTFVKIFKNDTIAIRTYERGVEGETQACGTGAVAAALISHKIHQLSSPVQVNVRSGEQIKVSFNSDWSHLTMIGPVRKLENPYNGSF